MITLATIEQIRAIEIESDANGYSYEDMMDNAGRTIAERSAIILENIPEPRITVIVGKGNNGGDGLIAGLYIAQNNPNADVRFYLLADRDDEYTKTAREAGLFVALADDDKDKRVLRNMIASADLVIDALFGIGARIPIKGEAQKILRNVNRELNARASTHVDFIITPAEPNSKRILAPIYVLAVDCPSGINCDTGEADSNAIHADETITFISAKNGQFLYPAADYIGKLSVADISISKKLDTVKTLEDSVIDANWVKDKLPSRGNNGHKGTYGRALIIAGSVNYIGAPALSAEATYRSGAGLVTVATPMSVVMALAGKLTEVTWMMLAHDMGVISENALNTVLKDLSKMKSLLIGPGLSTEKTTGEFVKQLLAVSNEKKKPAKRRIGFGVQGDDNTEKIERENISLPPLVIDADGLNLLAKIDKWWELLPENTILTPHPGEMGRLCDISTQEVQDNRWQLARDKAQEWGVTLVLKGAYTVIASADGQFAVNPFAVDALATAGTGDILAGLIAGLRAQGVSAFDAACIGAYVHGLAGQLASNTANSRSLLASDILAYIGEAFTAIEG
ncbi:MAG: bifunctional ADP-dependent NAD(P)H-hydrate dehydratase/NAD(P)H-hydrate epimerase [Phototrophicaceae bacterium]